MCNAWQRSRTQNLQRVGEISGPILTSLWTKVQKNYRRCRSYIVGDPSYFPTPLLDCLCYASFRSYSPLSLEVVKKPNKCRSFLGSNFSDGPPRLFYCKLLARLTVQRLAKFGGVPFAKPGNELECRIYVGWVKWRPNFKPFVDQSSCRFETM